MLFQFGLNLKINFSLNGQKKKSTTGSFLTQKETHEKHLLNNIFF